MLCRRLGARGTSTQHANHLRTVLSPHSQSYSGQRIQSFKSTATGRSPDFHRTYFQRDSPPFLRNQQVQAASQSSGSHGSYEYVATDSSGRVWAFAAGVLVALPSGMLISMYLLTGGYIPGWETTSTAEVLEQLSEANDQVTQNSSTVNGLNQASYKLHQLIVDLLSPSVGVRLIRDEELLRSRPLKLASGKTLDPVDGALIRVVDRWGKNRGIIFAFEQQPDPIARNDEWEVDWQVVDWLDIIGKTLHAQGRNAHYDLPMIVYTPEYFGVYKGAMEGFIWTRLENRAFQSGFPLRQLKEIPIEKQD